MSDFDVQEKKQADALIKKARLLRTRNQRKISFNAIVLGVYGWHLSIPVLIGIIVGRMLDKYAALPPMSWTLNCILIGFIAGFINANRWTRSAGVYDNLAQTEQEKKQRLEQNLNRERQKENERDTHA